MSGQKGQRGPLTFRCYRCKRGGHVHTPENRHRGTNWQATGEVVVDDFDGEIVEAQYRCLDCGHKGWSTHERVIALAKRSLEDN